MHNIFVYGSLRKGHGNHSLLDRKDVKFVGTFQTKPFYKLYSLGSFPALRGPIINTTHPAVPDESAVVGEIYEVNNAVLADLDMLEGHPTFYKRDSILLQDFSEPVQAYFHVKPVSENQRCDPDWNNVFYHPIT